MKKFEFILDKICLKIIFILRQALIHGIKENFDDLFLFYFF